MHIEAVTRIDYPAYRKFFLFSFLQGKRSRWQAPLMLALAPLLTIAFLVMYLNNPADVVNLVGVILMLGLSLALAAIIMFMPRRYYKSLEQQLMIPVHYSFESDQLVFYAGDDTDLATNYPYEKIEKAYETADSFYINLGPGRICIIGRQDFTAGSANDLHALLQGKLGDRLLMSKR
jgi:hypothetical protein